MGEKTILSFEDVSFSYNGKNSVLNRVSLSIKEKEKVALLGLNGAGKSTLMLHTNGLLVPSTGEVIVDSLSTGSKKNLTEIRKKVGIVFQNPDDQLFMPTVWDDVAFGPINMGLNREEVERRVEEALTLTHTDELASKFPYDLSGGQKKSVSIATVLSMRPEILVMDEPTSGLDYKSVANLVDILEQLPQTLILSTHDIEIARRLCHRAIVIDGGVIVYDGDIKSLEYPPRYNR